MRGVQVSRPQGRFTQWARWARAQGPAVEGAPRLIRRALRGLGILEIASSFVVFTCVC